MSFFTERDGVRVHYQVHSADDPELARQTPLLLLHGLTANARCFDGVIAAGLPQHRTVITVDLRGRGLSGQPERGYAPADHAADILAALDQLGLTEVIICGHSYGALIGLELATQSPERVRQLALLDIGGTSIRNPQVLALIQSSLARLGKTMPSMEQFLAEMRAMPFLGGYWDAALESFYRADVEPLPDGSVRVRIPPQVIQQVTQEGQAIDWNARLAATRQPALLVHACGGYGPPGTPALILEAQAREAAELLSNAKFVQVPGNHMTMLFGEHAERLVSELAAFISK